MNHRERAAKWVEYYAGFPEIADLGAPTATGAENRQAFAERLVVAFEEVASEERLAAEVKCSECGAPAEVCLECAQKGVR